MMSTLIVVIGDDAFLWWPMIPVVVLTVVRVQTLIDNSDDSYATTMVMVMVMVMTSMT